MASPCDGCFVRRVKCDRQRPCQTCLMRQQTCTYLRVRKRPGPKGPRSDTTRKIEEIQRGATADVEMVTPEAESPVRHALNSRIPISSYYAVFDVFQARVHDIWPIADIEQLKCQLQNSDNDLLSNALAAALCAATLAQLRLGLTPTPYPENLSATAEDFAKECLRIRLEHHNHQKPSLEALVTSVFLHMYHANRDQITPATISLREAITYADLLHLGHTPPSDPAQSKKWQLELRCYWILFVTERLVHYLPGNSSKFSSNLYTRIIPTGRFASNMISQSHSKEYQISQKLSVIPPKGIYMQDSALLFNYSCMYSVFLFYPRRQAKLSRQQMCIQKIVYRTFNNKYKSECLDSKSLPKYSMWIF